jgi:hypothetical protein
MYVGYRELGHTDNAIPSIFPVNHLPDGLRYPEDLVWTSIRYLEAIRRRNTRIATYLRNFTYKPGPRKQNSLARVLACS